MEDFSKLFEILQSERVSEVIDSFRDITPNAKLYLGEKILEFMEGKFDDDPILSKLKLAIQMSGYGWTQEDILQTRANLQRA